MQNRVNHFIFLFVFCLLSCSARSSVRYSINEGWRFTKGRPDTDTLSGGDRKIVSFPHTWNDRDAADDTPGYFRGEAWYAKTMRIPSSFRDKTVYIYFEGANQVTDLYIDGNHAGRHKGGYTRFCFDVSAYLVPGGEHLLAIRVDNAHDRMIPPLSADFTFFGGVYRDVYLDVRELVHISPTDMASSGVYVSTSGVESGDARLEINTLINNASDRKKKIVIEHRLYSPDGSPVARSEQRYTVEPGAVNREFQTAIGVRQPVLWSTHEPNLYTVRTEIRDAETKQILDSALHTTGFRWFGFDADRGFFLNGQHLKLIGTNRHQCFSGKGNALEDQYHVRDMRLLKEMGGNFLRISHYPQDPLILEMCDRLGIVASVEIPIVNAVTQDQEFLDNSLVMAEEMVKQNFNHPSLVMWSYMNEVMLRPPYREDEPEYRPYCDEVNRQANAIEQRIRTLDPSRYTMVAFHGSVRAYRNAGMFDVPMIIGWNLYQGWYGDTFGQFGEFLLDYRAQYPGKPTLITEYGADVDTRIHSAQPERFDFSVEYGDLYHEHYLKTILTHDFIAGASIWNLNDFYSELRSNAIPHVNTKGITTLDRTPKNTYYLYKAHFTQAPFVKIASGDWTLRNGVETEDGICTQRIKVYSNRDTVAVFHNGARLADVPMTDRVGEIDIPFVGGANRIEARIETLNLSDVCEVDFDVIPRKLNRNFQELNVLLGTNRMFWAPQGRVMWTSEREYTPGGWGTVGGRPYRPQTRFGTLPAVELSIAGTDSDPVYQTQRIGIEAFRADVPDGRYAVYLHWADIRNTELGEGLIYNLGNDRLHEQTQKSIFDVYVNGRKTIEGYDLLAEAGAARAVVKKITVDVSHGNGLRVELKPVEGQTILNAIRILRIN